MAHEYSLLKLNAGPPLLPTAMGAVVTHVGLILRRRLLRLPPENPMRMITFDQTR